MLASSGVAVAQGLHSAYFTQDYKYRHTMNPAFGNEQSYVAIPVLGNVTVNTMGNFGYEDVVLDNPRYGNGSDKKTTTFMHPDISVGDALSGFNSGNNRIYGDVNISILSAGFKAFGGYNTIELNSRTTLGVALPYDLFAFAKNIGNKTYDIGDLNMHAQSFAELAFGHSRDINDKLRVGAKFKLLFGLGRADVEFKDVKADLASDDKWTLSGTAEANVSIKGFKFETETTEYESKAGTYEKVEDVDVDGFGLGGFGMAIDLGAVYKLNQDWTFSASLLDLGFISWSDNVSAVNASDKFEFNGFHDMSIKDGIGSGTPFDDQADDYGDQISDFANLKDNGNTGGRTTGIGMTINLGAEYNLPVYRKVTFGFLSSTRIQGIYSWTEGRLSANYTPLKWIDGGVSFAVNSFATSMGWVLNIHPKGLNFFIGMDHILGKQTKEGIPFKPNASLTLGMNITW